VSLTSAAALVVWAFWIADDLSRFTDKLPDVPLLVVVVNGIAFAW